MPIQWSSKRALTRRLRLPGADPIELRIHARVAAGQSILVQVTYDPAWHAYAGGEALPVHRDRGADFSVIDAPPGDQDIAFVFETPLENRIGYIVTLMAMVIAAVLLARWRGSVSTA